MPELFLLSTFVPVKELDFCDDSWLLDLETCDFAILDEDGSLEVINVPVAVSSLINTSS